MTNYLGGFLIPSKDIEFPKVAYGKAVLATSEDIERDELGYTHPNLHRRVDIQDREVGNPYDTYNMYEDVPQFEFGPRSYKFFVSGYNSYRLTNMTNHDEESTYWEIP